MLTFFAVVLCVLIGAATTAITVAGIRIAYRWAGRWADWKDTEAKQREEIK